MTPRRTASALFVLLAATAAHATTYNHVTLIDGTGAAARRDMAIVVEGERITAITRAGNSGIDMHGAFALHPRQGPHVERPV